MSKKIKTMMVEELSQRYSDLGKKGAVVVKYSGVTAQESVELRRILREQGVELRVVRNALLTVIGKQQGIRGLESLLVGPCAIIRGPDPVTSAKAATETVRKLDKLEIRGGILEGGTISAAQVDALSHTPPIEQLQAQIAGAIAAPIRSLMGTIKAVPQKLVGTLDAVKEKKQGGS